MNHWDFLFKELKFGGSLGGGFCDVNDAGPKQVCMTEVNLDEK